MKEENTIQPRLLTYSQASEYLNLSEGMIRKWVKNGLLKVIHFGKSARIDVRDIDKLISRLKEDNGKGI